MVDAPGIEADVAAGSVSHHQPCLHGETSVVRGSKPAQLFGHTGHARLTALVAQADNDGDEEAHQE